jgi:acetyltransferase-like isoleucine patch superfamily enzyme
VNRKLSEIPKAQEQLFAAGSAREKYSALVVGRPGWGALLKYEAVQLLSQHVPGALGLALRKALFPSLLGACGRNVIFGQNVVLRHPHKIRIGDNVVIDDNCLVDAKGTTNRGITIGSGVFVGRNTILSCKNGDIDVADGANVGFNCEIFSASRVTIGRDTLLAAYCYVIGGDHDFSDPSAAVLAQGRRSAGVTVGAGAWLGAGAKILDGVAIGDRAIVGAGAVVREAVPDGAIAVGIPARIVGQRGQRDGAAGPEPGREVDA